MKKENPKEIPEEIKRAADVVYECVPTLTRWISIKVLIMRQVRWQLRALFSLRDPVTKKPRINDFDRLVMAYWQEIGGKLDN